jgi:hypothetical protein
MAYIDTTVSIEEKTAAVKFLKSIAQKKLN